MKNFVGVKSVVKVDNQLFEDTIEVVTISSAPMRDLFFNRFLANSDSMEFEDHFVSLKILPCGRYESKNGES